MIDRMNLHYSFENPASVYDEEALTALELAGRQGKKINEVINDQNALRQETEEHLGTQDKTIQERMNKQDADITHIRNVTVPADVKAECQRLIEAGEFDQAINLYMNNLNSRVDNLLGSVQEGSTTLDAEVIDMRVGADGTKFNDAGTAIRTQFTHINNRFNIELLNKCKIIKNKNVAVSTQYTVINDENSYLLLVPQSEFIFLQINKDEINNTDKCVLYCTEDLTTKSGLKVTDDVIPNRSVADYPYVALPYSIHNLKPTLGGIFKSINPNTNDDVIKYGNLPNSAKLVEDNGNLIDISKSVIDHRWLYNIVYPGGGYICTNLFPVDVSAIYYFNGYLNNNSNMILILFDGNFNRLGEISLNTTNVKNEAVSIDWLLGNQSFSCDLSEVASDYPTAHYGFISMCYTTNEKFTLDNLYFKKGGPLTSLYKEEKYQIKRENALKIGNCYYGKAFSAIGDSITAQGYYEQFVRAKLGLWGYKCNGVGGSKVSGVNVDSFWQDSRINAVASETDLITICGGVNDCGSNVEIGALSIDNFDTNTFIGAYNVMLSKLYYKFLSLENGYYEIDYSGVVQNDTPKNIKIVLMSPPKCFGNTSAKNLDVYADAVKRVGEMWGLPVCDLYGELNINDMNKSLFYSNSDGTHPTIEGHKMIANLLIGTLKRANVFDVE